MHAISIRRPLPGWLIAVALLVGACRSPVTTLGDGGDAGDGGACDGSQCAIVCDGGCSDAGDAGGDGGAGDGGPITTCANGVGLSISDSPFVIGVTASLTITATSCDDAQWSNGVVDFTTGWGSFADPTAHPVAGTLTVPISSGQAVVTLYPPLNDAPPVSGSAAITALRTDSDGGLSSAALNLPVIAATTAIVTDLSFSCSPANVGAFADTDSNVVVPCSAVARDGFGHVADAQINFLAEAGAVSFDSTNSTFVYKPTAVGPGNVSGNKPLDVAPRADLGEPSYVDTNTTMSPTRNPRDGLVTLVAYVEARSDAVSANTTAYAPYGGAPFVDADDTGSFHAGDAFVDVNSNLTYATTQSRFLWKQIKVLWTGTVQSQQPVATATFDGADVDAGVELTYPGEGTLVWPLLDQNLNVVASTDSVNDDVQWSCSPEPNVTPDSDSALLDSGDPDRFGMCLDAQYNLVSTCCDPGNLFVCWEIGSGSRSPSRTSRPAS